MVLAQRLDIRQSHSLVLTPALQQSLKLLQMPSLDILPVLSEELQTNPFLSLAEDEEYAADNADNENKESLSESTSQNEEELFSWEGDAPSMDAFEESVSDFSRLSNGTQKFDSDEEFYTSSLASPPSLESHLIAQIPALKLETSEHHIALRLIGSLDEKGWLSDSLNEIANELKVSEREVEKVLFSLQQLDPIGIFARDLNESLRLQLDEKNALTAEMELLIEHLELLSSHNYQTLAKKCGISLNELTPLLALLQTLSPYPAEKFLEHAHTQNIIPDVYVLSSARGNFRVEFNSESLPKLMVNRRYYAEIKTKLSNEVEKKFVTDHLQNAHGLVKALEQRAHTILRVATEIVNQEREFFSKGISALKPLTLAKIAEILSLHESTISRVVNGKYMSTPQGLLEFKYFFTSSVSVNEDNEGLSSTTVKHRIKMLISDENPFSPLSDDDLVKQLKDKNIDIARRTVAKYRESLNIPSSFQRKRANARVVSLHKN